MLYEDEDDFFVGSPRSKFFDILFNANRDLVENALEKHTPWTSNKKIIFIFI